MKKKKKKRFREQEVTFIGARWVIFYFLFFFSFGLLSILWGNKRMQNGESGELRTSKRSETEVLWINVGLHEFFLDNTALLWKRRAKNWEDWAKGADSSHCGCCHDLFSHYFFIIAALTVVSKEHVLDLSRVLRLTFTLSADVFAFDGMRSHWTESKTCTRRFKFK